MPEVQNLDHMLIFADLVVDQNWTVELPSGPKVKLGQHQVFGSVVI